MVIAGAGAACRAKGAPLGGSAALGEADPSQVQNEGLSEHARLVLAAMGNRGGWHSDRLIESTKLGFGTVCGAVLELALAGKIQEEPLGYYSPAERLPAGGGRAGAG